MTEEGIDRIRHAVDIALKLATARSLCDLSLLILLSFWIVIVHLLKPLDAQMSR